jgi:hypothetical protein
MRRVYEYLQSSGTLSDAQKRTNFFYKIDKSLNQRQYIRITLLNWAEKPLKEVQGIVTSGSLTKDGSSSVRRTMTLTVNLDGGEYDATSLDMDFSLNKKVFVELGVKNDTDEWTQYPILWFPQGVFFINKASMSSSASSSVSLTLNLRDKMSMLNGDVGGIIPASTIFDSIDTQSSTGQFISQKVTVYELIENVVNHFGNEDLCNIVIEDVDLKIRRVVRWTAENPLYLVKTYEEGVFKYYTATIEKPGEGADFIEVKQGDDCGYVYDDFVYTSDLTLNAGSKVTDVLDKIVSYLGNYEYFYDEFGIFHFREIKNYVNTTYATTAIKDMTKNSYLMNTIASKSSYAFSDGTNIINISSNPSYDNIKNDYIVEGLRKSTVSDVSYPVRYHLAIDEIPPKTYWDEEKKAFTYPPREGVVLYKDADTGQIKACFPKVYNSNPKEIGGAEADAVPLPDIGTLDIIYYDKSFKYQAKGVEGEEGRYQNDKKDIGKLLYYVRVPVTYKEETDPSSDYNGFYKPDTFKNVMVSGKDGEVEKLTSASSNTIKIFTQNPSTTVGEELKGGKDYKYNYEPYYKYEPSCAKWNGEGYEKLDVVAVHGKDNPYVAEDWRTELYLQGEYARTNGTDKGYYFEELSTGWTQIYDLEKQQFIGDDDKKNPVTLASLTDGNMFLDFIDAGTSSLGEYAVSAIGRRSDVVVDNDVNCLFQPNIPDIVFVDAEKNAESNSEISQELESKGERWSLTPKEIYSALATGGYKNGAFDRIKYELYLHTGYQRTLSITAIPAFYLEPSIRVSVKDKTTNTYGDYIVKSVTYTLGTGSTMTVNATELVERF